MGIKSFNPIKEVSGITTFNPVKEVKPVIDFKPIRGLGPTGLATEIGKPELGLQYTPIENVQGQISPGLYGQIKKPTAMEIFKSEYAREDQPLGMAKNIITKTYQASKIPSQQIRNLGEYIAQDIEKMPYWSESDKDTYWSTIKKGIIPTTIRTAFDTIALHYEPSVIATSGAVKYFGPSIMRTAIGQKAKQFFTKDVTEFIYANRVRKMEDVAKAMTEKFPQFRNIGEKNTLNWLKSVTKETGGWSKMTPQRIDKFISELNKVEVKPITKPTPLELPQAIKKPVTKPQVKDIVEKAGGQLEGIVEYEKGVPTVTFSDSEAGFGREITRSMPLSKVTLDSVKAELEKARENIKQAKPVAPEATPKQPLVEEAKKATPEKIEGNLQQKIELEEADMPLGLSINLYKPQTISENKKAVRELIRTKVGEEQVSLLESAAFQNQIQKELNIKEREAIPFILEKTGVPKKLNRPDLEKIVEAQAPKIKQVADKIRKYLDESHAYIIAQTGDDVNFIKDYVTHIWDIPNNKIRETVNWFSKINPFTKKRFIPTLEAGIEAGLKPKYLDINKILSVYDNYKAKISANIKFANSLVNLIDENGDKLVKRYDKAPDDWVMIDHYAFKRIRLMPGGYLEGKEVKPGLVTTKVPVKVHPEIAEEVKVLLDRQFDSKFLRALSVVNAFLKKSQLTFSLFHHMALTETGLATPRMFLRTISLWNPVKVWDALKNNNYEIFKKLPIAKDGLRNGLTLGGISDVQRGVVKKALEDIGRKYKDVPIIGTALRGLYNVNEIWDKALWDYYHNGLKLNAYEILTENYLRKYPTVNPIKIKQEIAGLVNDTYGGQNWQLLFKNPKWIQSMHLLLLSPDWTYSTMRQAVSPLGIGSIHKETRFIRRKLGQGFWLRAAVYFWGGMNILNHALTKKEDGKGKWMWENDPGHRTHLFIGYNKDGTKKYLRWGKQFRELPEAVADPVKKLLSKFSPIMQQLAVQATGRTLTGFKTDIEDKRFYDSMPARILELLRAPLPFSSKQIFKDGSFQPLGLAFPISKGMTPYTAKEHFVKALKSKDNDYVIDTAIACYENNLNGKMLLNQAVKDVLDEKEYRLRRKYKVRQVHELPQKEKDKLLLFRKDVIGYLTDISKQIPRKK